MSVLAHAADEAQALKCELATEVLRSSGSLRVQVTGWSMMPAVRPGDTLIVERLKDTSLCIGDIVLFGRDRRLFAHRLVKRVRNSQIMTQGDTMVAPDPVIGEDELLGRVAAVVRNGRSITPRRVPSFWNRAIAVSVRNSQLAARVFARVYRRLQTRTTSQNRAVACQN